MGEQQARTINDITFVVLPLGGKLSRRVQWDLMQVVGAGLSANRGLDLGRFDPRAKGFFLDLSNAFRALPFDEFEWICDRFTERTTVTIPEEGHQPKTVSLTKAYEGLFGGKGQRAFIPWFAFCLEVNFGDNFFSEVLANLGSAKEPSGSESPEEPTGSSGDST